MLNRELENTLNTAFKLARNKHHEFMTVEHLLLAMLGNDEAAEVLHVLVLAQVEVRKKVLTN